MNAIASISMSVVLLLHAALGCCRQHAHECDRHESAAVAMDPCCEDHQCPAEHEGPCNCRIECHGVCIYLPSQKVQIDCSQTVIPFELVALEASLVDCQVANPSSWEALGGSVDLPPPLRLHLLHQILLI